MNVSYETACKNQMVHDVVYIWLQSTKTKNPWPYLEDWRDGKIFLIIDGTKLKRPLHYGHDLPYQAAYLTAKFKRGF